MTIEIITAHEADQIARTRAPLRWPTHPTCNGNCQHGRACDCTSDLDDDDARQPMTRADALLAVTLVLASFGATIFLMALAAGWRP